MCGSECAARRVCISRMVVCIPHVFRVRAFRLWWVYLGVLGGFFVVGWSLGYVVVGYSVVGGGSEFGVSLGVGSSGCGLG